MQKIPGRVLCIECSKDACELVEACLSLSDYEVVTAFTAAEGFELASNQSSV
jgi:hypothetical protein